MTKDRKNRMVINKYADSVYVSARERVSKNSYTLIEEVPGVEHVTTSCGGYSTGVRFADTYDAEEVAARMVIIRAEQAGVDPADSGPSTKKQPCAELRRRCVSGRPKRTRGSQPKEPTGSGKR